MLKYKNPTHVLVPDYISEMTLERLLQAKVEKIKDYNGFIQYKIIYRNTK